jgi:hypothetical protein
LEQQERESAEVVGNYTSPNLCLLLSFLIFGGKLVHCDGRMLFYVSFGISKEWAGDDVKIDTTVIHG